jgi:hypothetical protein
MFARLVSSGHRVVYAPKALALHVVDPSREHPSWLFRRAFAQGQSDVALERGRGIVAGLLADLAFFALRGKRTLVKSLRENGPAGAGVTQGIQTAYVAGRVASRLRPRR